MKIKYLFILIVVFSLFISGCMTGEVVKDVEDSEQTNQVVCNKPYILVGNDCCLDQDDNSICDIDESQSSPSGEPILSQSVTIEECYTGGFIFECESSIINSNKITIKLKSNIANYYAPERIYLPQIGINGCELTLDTSFENALVYEESKVYEIPCDIDKDVVDTELIIDYMGYKPTTSVFDFDVETEEGEKLKTHDGSSKGRLMGMVR